MESKIYFKSILGILNGNIYFNENTKEWYMEHYVHLLWMIWLQKLLHIIHGNRQAYDRKTPIGFDVHYLFCLGNTCKVSCCCSVSLVMTY